MNPGIFSGVARRTDDGSSEKKNIRIFAGSGTFVAPESATYRFWVLGAGGSGGARYSCSSAGGATGGGGGEFRRGSQSLTAGQSVSITIGAGGTSVYDSTTGVAGGDTIVGYPVSITAKGGGAGQHIGTSTTTSGGIGGTGGSGGDYSAAGGNGGNFTQSSGTNRFSTGGGAAGSIYGAGGNGGYVTGTGFDAATGGGAVGVSAAVKTTTGYEAGAGVGGTNATISPGAGWAQIPYIGAVYDFSLSQASGAPVRGITDYYNSVPAISGSLNPNPIAAFWGSGCAGAGTVNYAGSGGGGGGYANTVTHYGGKGGTCGGGGAAFITTAASANANGGAGGRGAGGGAAVTAYSNSGYNTSGPGGDGLVVIEW